MKCHRNDQKAKAIDSSHFEDVTVCLPVGDFDDGAFEKDKCRYKMVAKGAAGSLPSSSAIA